jgi:hypothetical protein
MSNEQLAFILGQYQTAVLQTLSEIKEQLPPDMLEERQPIIGPKYTVAPLLQPMYDLVQSMQENIDRLLLSETKK